jgi:hypothetical protein
MLRVMVIPTKPNRIPHRARRLLIATLVVTFVVGTALLVVGLINSEKRDEVWFEAATAGMQLLVVGVLGGTLTAAWKWTEETRADARRDAEATLQSRREVHQRQLATFTQVVASYNGVKAVRRTLRSLGFESTDGTLDSQQADGFHAQMDRLNELQLVFEAMVRELSESRLFRADTDTITRHLSQVERHLAGVLRMWEVSGVQVRQGASIAPASSGIHSLLNRDAFTDQIVTPRRRLTEAMHKHLFGVASPDQLEALAALEVEQDADG